ncbi:unnamed protein product [marine sediment metagenome]|uniref:Uncharacterized protein n=1 Tax=marine sediment metagenome TaxID=412755 RepID=X1NM62_9ZZZZ
MIDLKDVGETIKNRRLVVTQNDRGDTLTGYLIEKKTDKQGKIILIFEDRYGERVEGSLSRFSHYPVPVG